MADPEDKYRSLVARLLDGTKGGSVEWSVDIFRSDIYTSQGKYKLVIASEEDGEGSPFISLQVKDGRGRVIDSFTDNDLAGGFRGIGPYGSAWQAMSALFHMARRQAYGADEALDDILKALDGESDEEEGSH